MPHRQCNGCKPVLCRCFRGEPSTITHAPAGGMVEARGWSVAPHHKCRRWNNTTFTTLVLQFIGIARTQRLPAELCSRSYRVKILVPRGALVAMALGLSPLKRIPCEDSPPEVDRGERGPSRAGYGRRPIAHVGPFEEAAGDRDAWAQAQARPHVAAPSQL